MTATRNVDEINTRKEKKKDKDKTGCVPFFLVCFLKAEGSRGGREGRGEGSSETLSLGNV